MFKNMRIGTKIALSISALMIIIFVAFTSLIVSKARESSIHQAQNLAGEMAGRYGNEVKGIIEKALDASWAGAAAILSMTEYKENIHRDMVDDFIKSLTEVDPMFFGTQIVLQPNELDGRDAEFVGNEKYGPNGEYGQYGWYDSGTWKLAEMHKNDPNNTRAWYMIPRDTKKAVLTEPYTTTIVPEIMSTVSVPILKNGKFIGVVGIDFVLGSFEKMVKDIHPWKPDTLSSPPTKVTA